MDGVCRNGGSTKAWYVWLRTSRRGNAIEAESQPHRSRYASGGNECVCLFGSASLPGVCSAWEERCKCQPPFVHMCKEYFVRIYLTLYVLLG